MTSLPALLAAAEPVEGGFRAHVPANWLQGRTAYGGFSSALALEAALRCEPDLPPLRSAQIAFIGPLAGAVTVTATKLRRGRNAAFVQADVTSDAGLGLRATFVFMAERESAVRHDAGLATDRRPPAPDQALYQGPPEFFTSNFQFLDLKAEAHGPTEWLRWGRLIEREGLHPAVELMAVADALPPAAMKLLGSFGPVSSLTWQLNLTTSPPQTQDGWWLLRAEADAAAGGSSSQNMTLWNAEGLLAVQAMQSVALFV
ncbi:thioesterase family protein [Sphingomonas aracearum]|uniref:Thioesterase family protein n=1 Tax=Sphingomonas aracearum TaxID=2283317 RepID=A0A369VWL3_9SPHN|nr:thioesterase family protein [Sphingomonas aracearum]RDE06776.1 thioesterase family protein [Sphingomonas aracearum]